MSADDRAVTEPGATTRRALFLGAGAVGASVVLTACGDGGGALTGGAGSAPSGGGSASGPLGKTGDIPVGGGKVFPQGVVVTQPAAGEFKCFSAICTHQGCPVSTVDGGTINCTCHGSRFSIEDGSVKGGPATRPLAAKNVKVDGDDITLA